MGYLDVVGGGTLVFDRRAHKARAGQEDRQQGPHACTRLSARAPASMGCAALAASLGRGSCLLHGLAQLHPPTLDAPLYLPPMRPVRTPSPPAPCQGDPPHNAVPLIRRLPGGRAARARAGRGDARPAAGAGGKAGCPAVRVGRTPAHTCCGINARRVMAASSLSLYNRLPAGGVVGRAHPPALRPAAMPRRMASRHPPPSLLAGAPRMVRRRRDGARGRRNRGARHRQRQRLPARGHAHAGVWAAGPLRVQPGLCVCGQARAGAAGASGPACWPAPPAPLWQHKHNPLHHTHVHTPWCHTPVPPQSVRAKEPALAASADGAPADRNITVVYRWRRRAGGAQQSAHATGRRVPPPPPLAACFAA